MVQRAKGSVANLGLLGRFGDSYVVEGDEVYVASEKTWYYYSLTTEGQDAVKAQYIAGYWCRKESDAGAFNTQLVWYVNSVTGDDNNDGLTSGTAIKTFNKLRERVGTPWYMPAAQVDIYVSGVFPLPDTLELDIVRSVNPSVPSDASVVVFHGAETVLFTGPVAAHTAMARATNVRPNVQVVGAPWGTYDWDNSHLLKDTTSTPAKYSWIEANMGGNVAQLGAWLQFDPADPTINPASAAPVNGDSVSIIGSPIIAATSIKVRAVTRLATAAVVFDNIGLYPYLQLEGPGAIFLLSNCGIFGCAASYGPGLTVMQNCMTYAGTHVVTGNLAQLGGLFMNTTFALAGGNAQLDYDAMYEGSASIVVPEGFQGAMLIDTAAFFQATGNGLNIRPGELVRLRTFISGVRTLWGACSGAPSYGVAIESRGRFVYDPAALANIVLTGVTGNFSIAGAATALPFDITVPGYIAAVACTWANLIQTVALGGFGGNILDPVSGAGCFCLDHPWP